MMRRARLNIFMWSSPACLTTREKVVGSQGILFDVTQRKQIEAPNWPTNAICWAP